LNRIHRPAQSIKSKKHVAILRAGEARGDASAEGGSSMRDFVSIESASNSEGIVM